MSIQQRLMAREPLDAWSVREQLCLASAVARNGDQNWAAVSRALRAVGEPSRPPDWYRQKACAAQYSALLEAEDTPKRKKRTTEPASASTTPATDTPQESILKRLTAERISELQQLMQDIKSQYAVLKDEVAEVRSPATSEARVREMLSSVEAVRRQRERDQQRHALWLRERDERRLRAEKARRPLVAAMPGGLSPPASSPLLTSLLKNASASTAPAAPATQLLHIPHPSTVIDTVSPSAGAPTLSMLLERGREGALAAPPPPPPAPPAPNETAVIEHIKSQLQEIEHNLRLGAMASPAAPAADKVDIDDIEIKAEDVYAFSDMDLEIPPVSTIHKSSLARSIEKGAFTKKEETEPDLELPAPADAAPDPLESKLAPEVEAAEAPVEAPVAAEVAPVPPELAPAADVPIETTIEDGKEVSIPIPPESVTVAPAEPLPPSAAAPSPPPSPPVLPSELPPEPAIEPTTNPAVESAIETATEPAAEPATEPAMELSAQPPLDSPPPEDPIEAEMKEMHSETPAERREATPPPPSPPPNQPAAAPDDPPPVSGAVKAEGAWDEAEAAVGGEGSGDAAETPAPVAPPADTDLPPLEIKKEEEEWEAVAEAPAAEAAGAGAEGAERPSEPEETHTETDDDTPMEVIREEETEGRRRRDYSRRKTRPLSDSQACSGSESAAESAPPSPAPRAASPPAPAPSTTTTTSAATAAADPDREHRLWKKSVMLVYNRLCAHKYASLFLRPITDEVAPDYSLVVRRPMDLHTIKRNMDSGVIRTTAEFQRDVLLMLSNALFYNNSRDRVHHMAQDMHEEAAAQLGMLLQAQAHAALADATATPPARRAPPHHAKRKRTSSASASAAGSPAAKRPRDD